MAGSEKRLLMHRCMNHSNSEGQDGIPTAGMWVAGIFVIPKDSQSKLSPPAARKWYTYSFWPAPECLCQTHFTIGDMLRLHNLWVLHKVRIYLVVSPVCLSCGTEGTDKKDKDFLIVIKKEHNFFLLFPSSLHLQRNKLRHVFWKRSRSTRNHLSRRN